MAELTVIQQEVIRLYELSSGKLLNFPFKGFGYLHRSWDADLEMESSTPQLCYDVKLGFNPKVSDIEFYLRTGSHIRFFSNPKSSRLAPPRGCGSRIA